MKKLELDELYKQAQELSSHSNITDIVLAALIQAHATEKASVTVAESLDYVAREIKAGAVLQAMTEAKHGNTIGESLNRVAREIKAYGETH